MNNDMKELRDDILHEAAAKGDIDRVKALIAKGYEVDKKDSAEATPLHQAAEKGHYEIVEFLISKDANVNAVEDIWWYTPLLLAARKGHINVVRLLLKHNADPYRIDEADISVIHFAAIEGNIELMKILLDHGVDPNYTVSRGPTPWQLAKEYGHEKVAKLLEEHGAKTDLRKPVGSIHRTIIESANEMDVANLRRHLLHNGDPNAQDEDGNTLLHKAAKLGSVKQVKALIELHADVNARNRSGDTPLERAAFWNRPAVIKLLLEKGADVNAGNPLRSTAMMGNVEIAKILIDHGAHVNFSDGVDSPLHVAVAETTQWDGAKEKGCLLVAKLLIERGANIEAKNNRRETPLQRAIACGTLASVKLLLEAGADIHTKDILHKTPLENAEGEIKQFVKEQILARSSLHMAAAADDISAIELFISNKADINNSREGKTPLHWAVAFNRHQAAKILIEHGAEVNIVDKEGSTPLRIAKKNHYKKLIKLLKKYGGRK